MTQVAFIKKIIIHLFPCLLPTLIYKSGNCNENFIKQVLFISLTAQAIEFDRVYRYWNIIWKHVRSWTFVENKILLSTVTVTYFLKPHPITSSYDGGSEEPEKVEVEGVVDVTAESIKNKNNIIKVRNNCKWMIEFIEYYLAGSQWLQNKEVIKKSMVICLGISIAYLKQV